LAGGERNNLLATSRLLHAISGLRRQVHGVLVGYAPILSSDTNRLAVVLLESIIYNNWLRSQTTKTILALELTTTKVLYAAFMMPSRAVLQHSAMATGFYT